LDINVLITSTSFGKVVKEPVEILKSKGYRLIWNKSGRPLKEDELVEKVHDVDAWIAGVDEITAKVISAANNLKIICRYGVGVDNVDLREATKRGIIVTNTPDANSDAVADLTIGLILAVARWIPQADKAVKEGKWDRFFGYSVYDKTLGIIGMGKIGIKVMQRAQGFKMKIIYSDPRKNYEAEKMGARKVDLDELLREADFISIHTPLTSKTKYLIGESELSKMRSTSFLINTARGKLVDEIALYRYLKEKKIAGAAVDVYSKEPPGESPLLSLDNVVTTPHIGGYTYEALYNMGMMVVKSLIDTLEGKKPDYMVNPEAYK